MFWVNQKRSLAIGNRTPILHCAGGKIRNSNKIQNWQWIRNVKIFIVKGKGFGGAFKSEFGLMFFTWGHKNPHQCSLFYSGFNMLKFTDDESQKIGGHFRSRRKNHLA